MPLNLLLNERLAQKLVFSLRIPRLIMAALLGMSLAACGEVLQMLFQNPIVEPGFLGVSQGAAFGASLAILFLGGSLVNVEIMAAAFALLGLALSFAISRLIKFGGWVLRLVLSGIVVSAIMSSGLGILKYIADPLTELQEITFWLLGGLWSTNWSDVLFILPVVVVCLSIVLLMRWRLNVLSLNDATAFSLGAATTRERVFLLICAVIAVAAVTSVSGIVNWVGLIVPHLSRRIFERHFRKGVPKEVEINLSRTAYQWEKSVNNAIDAMRTQATSYIHEELATIEAMLSGTQGQTDDIKQLIAQIKNLSDDLSE